MKIHVSELEGRALDWAVCLVVNRHTNICWPDLAKFDFKPSSDWNHCGLMIEEFNIWLRGPVFDGDGCAADFGGDRMKRGFGQTPLIAVCRAIVAAKLGEEVEIPDELMG